MLATMKIPRRTPTTMPMVVFVLEVSRLCNPDHFVRCDKLDLSEMVSAAEVARAVGGTEEEVSRRE